MKLTQMTTDQFIEVKDAIEDAIYGVLEGMGFDGYAEVDDDTNDPTNYVVGSDRLVIPLVLNDN